MKKLLLALLFLVLLGLGIAYILWQDGSKPNYGFVAFVLFWAAIAIGFVVRLVKARRGTLAERPFHPLDDPAKNLRGPAAGQEARGLGAVLPD